MALISDSDSRCWMEEGGTIREAPASWRGIEVETGLKKVPAAAGPSCCGIMRVLFFLRSSFIRTGGVLPRATISPPESDNVNMSL